MINAILFLSSLLIHYEAKAECVKSFGPTRPAYTCSAGWAVLKAKKVCWTDSTVTEYFAGKTIIYKIKRK